MMNSKGIILTGSGRAEVVSEAVATPTGTEVLVRTHAVGLCGSDLGLYRGTYEGPKNYPIYFGHEWSGTVEAVGPGVTRVRPGDKVTGDCSLYCGRCELCDRDRNLCQAIEKFGITVNGASRRLFLQEERYVYRADADADLDLVALSEPLAVGAHAVRNVRESRPSFDREKILVLGGGTIGLSCFFALTVLEGCRHVELFDIVESRRQKALDLGASELTDVLDAGRDAAHGAAHGAAHEAAHEGGDYGDLYSGQGYDVIFETSGAPPAFHRAVELLRPLGTIMALGFLPAIEFSLKQITLKAARIMGSIGGTGDFERVLAFAQQHRHLAAELVSHRIPFGEYKRAFELAQDRRKAMKVLLIFDEAE